VCPDGVDHARISSSDGLGDVTVPIVTRRGDGRLRQPDGGGTAEVGATDVGRPDVPLVPLGVAEGVVTSVGISVGVGVDVSVDVDVGRSWVRAGVVVGAVVRWAGAVVDAGTWLPAPLVAVAAVSGLM
jgi:hypothetical protein